MTLMAQRIWSCGCLPGSDCQVSSAEGGFRLGAACDAAHLNVGRSSHLSLEDGRVDRPLHLRHRPRRPAWSRFERESSRSK